MKAPNLLALSAAIAITAASFAAVYERVDYAPVAEINGIHVIEMAPVNVTPTAEDLRAAALTAMVEVPTEAIVSGMDSRAEAYTGLVGSQMAMPYYSFGTQLGRITKD